MRSKLFKLFAVIMLFAMITPPVSAQAQADGPNLPEVNWPLLDESGTGQIVSRTGRYILLLEGNSLLEETGSAEDGTSDRGTGYLDILAAQREEILNKIEAQLGHPLRVHFVYDILDHGVSVELSATEIDEVAALPEVQRIFPVTIEHPLTDAGPEWIGADSLWKGSAVPDGVGTEGEGILVGIIDTGINFDHPSFSDTPADEFVYHWDGDYLGVCNPTTGDPNYAEACNDKLVGAYSFVDEEVTPEDSDGHGSHTASTVAGNTINIPDGPTISGVAPHAQIVAYDACREGGCPGDALVASIDQAVVDGVNVINYSISGGTDPANDAVEYYFLLATNYGVTVATSAGNSGPDAGTVAHRSPWVLSTAAITHNRTITSVVDFSHEAYVDIWTLSGSIPFSEDILFEDVVYAGEDAGNDFACDAFPEDFFADSIALIKRGGCTFDAKVDKAEAAGALGVLVFTDTRAPGAMGGISATIPNVMLDIPGSLGDEIAAWVAAETDENVSIKAEEAIVEDSIADIMADFSSRGPNTTFDLLKPDLGAPGVEIYAAYADSTITPDEFADYAFLQGTSMSSPHAAGSAALLKALHPDWSSAAIRSAMMLTAYEDVLDTDKVTPADPFDIGAGRIQLEKAGLVGLVMEETIGNYFNAVYGTGVDIKTLNTPSLQNSACVEECTWTRTFTSVADWPATYTVTAPAWVTVEPAVFTIAPEPDAIQEITITADVSGFGFGNWEFGSIAFDTTDTFQTLEPISDVHIPLAVQRSASDIPGMVAFETHRDSDGEVVKDLTAVEITEGTIYTSGLVKADLEEFELDSDSDNSDPVDNLDEVFVKKIDLPAYSIRFVAEITETTSPDLDMFLYWDSNANGEFDEEDFDYLIAYSATGTAYEYINMMGYAADYTFFLVVQNWAPEREGDSVTLATAIVPYGSDMGNMQVEIPTTQPAGEPFDMEITWDVDTEEGDRLYGFFETCADAACDTYLGGTDIDIHRLEDDVVKSVSVESAVAGETVVTYAIDVTNFKGEAITYAIEDVLPDGVTYVADSVMNAEYDPITNTISFEEEVDANDIVPITFDATVDEGLDPETIITNTAFHQGDGLGMLQEETAPVSFIAENEAPVAEDQELTTDEDVPLDITLTGTGLEPGPVTWDVDEPGYGTLTGEAPDLTYTPNEDWNGTDRFTFTVNDGLSTSDPATIVIDVVSVPDDPVAMDDEFDTGVNETLNDDVSSNDDDPDPTDTNQFFELLTEPTDGDLTFNVNGTFEYIPDTDFSGVDTFTYRFYSYPAGEEAGGSRAPYYDDATVTITVNDVPVAEAQTIEIDEDPAEPVAITLTVEDEDTLAPGPVTWTIVQDDDPETEDDPQHGTLTGTAPDLFYTPDPDYNGPDKFTFMVNDGLADSNEATVTITVTPVNDAPVAVDDEYETNEDATLTISAAKGVLANDEDVDEDTLTAILVDTVSNGTLTLSTDGSFVYAPTLNFHGEDSFTYKANDGTVDSNVATVTITVTAVNDAPVAVNDDEYETDEDTLLEISVEEGVLANDTDVEEDALTAVLVANAANGELTLNDDGSFTYLPDQDHNGSDTFTYMANDGTDDSNVATVIITINAVNDAPVAEDDEYWTDFKTELTVAAPGFLDNDMDVDEDTLTASLVGNPSHGVLVFKADGSFTYTPLPGYRGIDSFVYEVSEVLTDPALTDQATVYITVNDKPVALDGEYETDEEVPVDITLTQAEGPSLPGPATWTVIDEDEEAPGIQTKKGGTITFTTLPDLTYTPPVDFYGTDLNADSFDFYVNDGLNDSEPATITIEVLPVNDWPMAVDDYYENDFDTILNVSAEYGVLANDIDPDDQYEYVGLVNDVDHGTLTLNPDGSFVYAPDTGFRGVDSFVYTFFATPMAPTAGPYEDTATVYITVDDKPVANDDTYDTDFQVELVVEAEEGLLLNDVDPDEEENEDGLVVELLVNPSYGTLMLNADGTFTYMPDDGFYGTDTFEYRLIEPDSLIDDEATVTINIAQKPIAVDDEYWTDFNTPLTVEAPGVLANDIVTEPEELEVRLGLVDDVDVDMGSLTLNEDGSFEFIPTPGFLGEATFTYKIYEVEVDPESEAETIVGEYSEPATVTIIVNQLPVALDQSLTTDEEVALSITLTGEFLEPGPAVWTVNDADEETEGIQTVEGGTITYTELPDLTYTPAVDFYGTDSFTFMVNDGLNDSNIATITIEVLLVNEPPVAMDDAYIIAEETELVVPAPGVLENDTDADGDQLTVELVTDVTNGTLILNPVGSFNYVPNVDFYGEDTFTYRVYDGYVYSDPATVTITVTDVSDVAEAVDDAYETDFETVLDIPAPGVLANDIQYDPTDELQAVRADDVQHGTLTLNADGSFTYIPDEGFYGTDSFTYYIFSVQRGNDISNEATVTITVKTPFTNQIYLPIILK